MSAFTGSFPDADGRYRQERLDAALDPSEPGWIGYLFRIDDAPAGFAVVRGLDAEERVINSFFLVNPARRGGHGTAAVEAITALDPGRWAVAFQDANTAAAVFWPRIAARLDPDFVLEHHAVPDRPDVPADAWVRFRRR
ncbi:GNAT family N-acetyltransferase [Planctomonas sp. JC2975]|nr:GNAT family N-acetyltransferase [Planctomonas sp. JC2975]